MNIKELLKGVAVVIDDKIKKPDGDLIGNIKNKLINSNIPIIEFEEIPDFRILKKIMNINFILLDWELYDKALRGTRAAEEYIKKNFKFIRKLKKEIFVPIFIFTNILPDDVKNQLIDKRLYFRSKTNYIFVYRKQDLFDKSYQKFYFFSLISKWLQDKPSIYVLKEWEKSLNEAKNKLFWDYYNINHKWPSILQKTFQKDGSDVNYELGNFIFKNIMARTEPIEFDENILKIEDNDLTKEEIRKILEAERFIKSDSLPDIPFTGDLFKVFKYELSKKATSKQELYFLNIRPDCDIAIRKGTTSKPDLYCLECEIVDEAKINNKNSNQIIFNKGTFIDKINNTYIAFIDNGKILQIKLKEIKIFNWNQELDPKNNNAQKRIFKTTRIGRILPPYITAIQQKYSFYLQRQGLPAIPEKAIKDE